MTDVPRRLRPDPAKRSRTIQTQTHTAHSAQGTTAAARPVRQTSRARPYNPAARGMVAASATFRDPATGLALGAYGDPSGVSDEVGAAGNYFAYDSGGPGVRLLLPGWYQVAASAAVSTATAGDAFRIFCLFSTPQTVEGSDIADLGGHATPTCMSLPFYDNGSGTVLQVVVENHSGSSGQINHPSIHVVAFA